MAKGGKAANGTNTGTPSQSPRSPSPKKKLQNSDSPTVVGPSPKKPKVWCRPTPLKGQESATQIEEYFKLLVPYVREKLKFELRKVGVLGKTTPCLSDRAADRAKPARRARRQLWRRASHWQPHRGAEWSTTI